MGLPLPPTGICCTIGMWVWEVVHSDGLFIGCSSTVNVLSNLIVPELIGLT